MRIKLSADVLKDLKRLKRKDPGILKKVEKQLAIFAHNPKHPSLRTHKLTGEIENRWSISVTKSLRMIYIVLKEEDGKIVAYFVAIGTHEQVYRE